MEDLIETLEKELEKAVLGGLSPRAMPARAEEQHTEKVTLLRQLVFEIQGLRFDMNAHARSIQGLPEQ